METKITLMSQRRSYFRETKQFEIKVGEKIVEVEKWWADMPLENEYEIDYEIMSVQNDRGEDVELTDEELDDLGGFVLDLS
jgi:hypothetical protein